jgi:ABC-type multidrug transport system fused ATPase/permease subunit
MSETMSSSVATADVHPIGLIVTDDLQRNRLTVFFRLLLAIPHFIVVLLWGIVAELAVLVAWFAALFTGRVPDGLHNFIASWLRYSTRVTAYIFLLADPFPPFGSGGSYPIDVRIDPAQPQSRLTVFFRLLLAIPALLLTYVFRAVNQIVALLGWFYALATGRMNEGMRNISAWLLRYETQTWGYVFLLTGRYPSLAGAPTA